jgi:hypothetical protein
MFVKKVFQLVKPFLANLKSTSFKKILIYVLVLNDPPNFLFIFLHMRMQNTQNFTLIKNPWK